MMLSSAETLLQRGIAAHRAGQLQPALEAYRAVLALQPDNAVAHHNLGLIFLGQGDATAAVGNLIRAVELLPDHMDFAFSLAEAARSAQWPENALQALGAFIARQRATTVPLHLYVALAEGLVFRGKHPDAVLHQFLPALALTETAPSTWHNLAFYLLQLNCCDAATTAVDKAIQQAPASSPSLLPQRLSSLSLKAAILRAQGRSVEALPFLREAAALAPDHAPTWNNLAALYRDQGDFVAADQAVQQAVALKPDYAAAWSTAGSVAFVLQDFGRAEACCKEALRIQPDLAEAHWNLALACLAQGDFSRGWAEYEWRLRLPAAPELYPDLGLPRWQGESLTGKTLLLHAEQGHGDTLQFIRLAQPLADQGVRVVALVQPALARLLAGCPFLADVHGTGGPVPTADFCLPLLSLPHRLGLTLDAIPIRTPYVFPTRGDISVWQERLAPRPRPRVGLVWAGDPRPNDSESNRIDQRRSLAFSSFSGILAIPGISFVSLQKGEAAASLIPQPNLYDAAGELADFGDTAALVTHLDLVITVDTAVAHLAGALGKDVWVLSRFDACWRWLEGREDSPWYRTLRLFRQAKPGDWSAPLAEVVRALDHRFNSRGNKETP